MSISTVLKGIDKVAPAVSVLSGCMSIAGTIYSMVEGGSPSEEDQTKLLSAIGQVNQNLEKIEGELDDINKVLTDIDEQLKSAEEIKILTVIANISTWSEDVCTLTPEADKTSYAKQILDASDSSSIVSTMNRLHVVLTQHIFSDNPELAGRITVPAYLYVRARLVQGLHLLGWACAYDTDHDYGVFLKDWSQNFYDQMKMLLDYSEKATEWSQSVITYKTNWRDRLFGGMHLPIYTFDSVFLAPLIDPDPPVDLLKNDYSGKYPPLFEDLDDKDKLWYQKNKLSIYNPSLTGYGPDALWVDFGYPNECAKTDMSEMENGLIQDIPDWSANAQGVTIGVWLNNIDFKPLKDEDTIREEAKTSRSPLDAIGLVGRRICEIMNEKDIILSFAHRRYDSIVYLGSSDGAPYWIPKDDANYQSYYDYFVIYDGSEKENVLTFALDKNGKLKLDDNGNVTNDVESQPFSGLSTLTGAIWRVQYIPPLDYDNSSFTYIAITPSVVPAFDSPQPDFIHTLGVDENGGWVICDGILNEPQGFITTVPENPQPLANPYEMKPVWAELKAFARGRGVNQHVKQVVFHKSPFTPS